MLCSVKKYVLSTTFHGICKNYLSNFVSVREYFKTSLGKPSEIYDRSVDGTYLNKKML